MQIPNLKKGDRIAIVGIAKRLETDLEDSLGLIREWGFEPIVYPSVYEQSGYFSGSDEVRSADFQSALDDSQIKAILFLRGGFGTAKILDSIDFDFFKNCPKWLIGFSDNTVALLMSEKLGVPAIHGPVAITLTRDKSSRQELKDLLEGKTTYLYALHESNETVEGLVEAPITGGNLCLVCDSIGTTSEIDTEGKVLFIEEVGEEMYAIDRMLNKLKRAGKFDHLRGLIVGSFSSISDRQSYYQQSVHELINSYFEALNIPMAFGLSAGHEEVNLPLIFGQKAQIDVKKESLSIDYIKE